MRNVTVAAVQMKCSKSVEKNIAHAEELVRQAAAKGAEIVLLPELFERPYFCQERRYEYYEYAQTAEENPAVRHFSRVATELGIVIPVSFYEKEVNNTYNSVAVLDADGKNHGVYRKLGTFQRPQTGDVCKNCREMTYKPKFHCRRQSGMNFGSVTENGVNSN